MEIEVLKSEKDKLTFVLKKSNSVFANTLRRLIINEVPTMAIEVVEFESNNSILYDEMIALRLGLLPLSTDLKSYTLPEECTCKGEGCAKCQVNLKLDAKSEGYVYASSLKSDDAAIKPVYAKMPIVKLIGEQDIKLTAKAQLGYGRVHSKWSPGHVSFKEVAQIEIPKDFEGAEQCISVCPKKGIFEMKGNKLVVNKDALTECTMCEACVDACPKGAIKLTSDNTSFIFTVESYGQLSPKEMLTTAFDMLDKQADQFKDLLK